MATEKFAQHTLYTLEMMTVTPEQVTDWLNRGKDVFIEKLIRDGKLTSQQGQEFMEQYLLTLQKNKTLSSSIRNFLGIDDDKNSTIICSKL